MKTLTMTLLVATLIMGPGMDQAWADPPPWAPAHGYRHKKDKHHYDYDDDHHHHYYGVLDGRCNREVIGTVLGGTVGGVIGGNTASDRTLGTVAGVIVGAVVGNVIGRAMDDADRYCTGHTLEYVEDGHSVTWQGSNGHVRYQVMPLNTYRSNASYCREFVVIRDGSGYNDEDHGEACRNPDGSWRLVH